LKEKRFWKKLKNCRMDDKKKIVMCFGTFDSPHPGHISYLKQAKKYGNYLIVVVARDKNVKKIKGQLPRKNERERLEEIKKIKFVNEAALGRIKNKYNIIKKYNPDIICLGYDQEVDLKKLRKECKGKIVRLKSYRENKYKSSKLQIHK